MFEVASTASGGRDSMSKPMSEQMQKLADRYEKATGKKFGAKTNAQKIRSMSDEELAKAMFNWFFMKEHYDRCVPEMRTPKKCNGRCISGILRWHQQPAEEKGHA